MSELIEQESKESLVKRLQDQEEYIQDVISKEYKYESEDRFNEVLYSALAVHGEIEKKLIRAL